MEKKSFKQFHNELSWSTRIYTLLVVLIVGLTFVFDVFATSWVMTILVALSVILFVETFAVTFQRHPKAWRTLRTILILILLSILFIALQGWV